MTLDTDPSRPRATPLIDYSTGSSGNPAATRAMVWAVLGVLPIIPSVVAIRYAKRGIVVASADPRAGGMGRARGAKIVAIVSILFWVAILCALVPAIYKARQQAMRYQCLSQLRQIGMAVMTYAAANRGRAPASFDELIAGGLLSPALLTCPEAKGKPPASRGAYGQYSYVYLGAGWSWWNLKGAGGIPLIYEPAWNHAGGDKLNVLFADGHGETVPVTAWPALLAKVPAPLTSLAPTTSTTPTSSTQPSTFQPTPDR